MKNIRECKIDLSEILKPQKPCFINPHDDRYWRMKEKINIVLYNYKYGINKTNRERVIDNFYYSQEKQRRYINYLVNLINYIINKIYIINNIESHIIKNTWDCDYEEKDIYKNIDILNNILQKDMNLDENQIKNIKELKIDFLQYNREFHFYKYIFFNKKIKNTIKEI